MMHEQDRSNGRRTHYPEIEPYRTGRLKVSDLHEIYFEECGNPDGKPVVHLHGGPGAGSQPIHRRNFDPAAYRIVSFDQRGAGKSTPHAERCDLVGSTALSQRLDPEDLREVMRRYRLAPPPHTPPSQG